MDRVRLTYGIPAGTYNPSHAYSACTACRRRYRQVRRIGPGKGNKAFLRPFTGYPSQNTGTLKQRETFPPRPGFRSVCSCCFVKIIYLSIIFFSVIVVEKVEKGKTRIFVPAVGKNASEFSILPVEISNVFPIEGGLFSHVREKKRKKRGKFGGKKGAVRRRFFTLFREKKKNSR